MVIFTSSSFSQIKKIPSESDSFWIPKPGFRERMESPYKTKRLENENECEVCIKSAEYNVSVYINGRYQGTTDLVIKNLKPGRYIVDLEKRGFEPERFEIIVKKGMYQEYRVKLFEIVGRIYVHDINYDCYVYVDGSSQNSAATDVPPGYHNVEVRKFGYNSYFENVYVYPYRVTHVYPQFTEATFSLTNFKASRTIINPNYENFLGNTEFSFYVTKDGSATLEIKNATGEVVWQTEWTNFYTWTQSVKWSPEKTLADGEYTAILKSGEIEKTLKIVLDRNYTYSMTSINSYGSGIGSLPAVYKNSMQMIVPYFNFGGTISENSQENSLSFQTGIFADFEKHFEFNAMFGFLTKKYDDYNLPTKLATSFKIFNSATISEKSFFCYGGLLHYGCTFYMNNLPFGIANGNGLGAAAIFGFDFSKFYLGFSSDYIFASFNGIDFSSPFVSKNAISFSYKPNYYVNFNIWSGINSAFYYDVKNFDFCRGINVGGEIVFMFGKSSFMGNLKYDANIVPNDNSYFYIGFCLSYLF